MSARFLFASSDPPGGGSIPPSASRAEFPQRDAITARDDDAIAVRIRAGDRDAYTTVFLAHYDGLVRFADSYVHDIEGAQELVQSVLARVWEQRTTFDPAAGVGAYLYAAVRNRGLNAVRDNRVRRAWWAAAESRSVAPGMATPPPLPIETLEREELAQLLRQAIDALPEHRRAVVTMRWFGGLRHSEIAAALGTSVNAVEIQLRRALADLAQRLPAHLRP